MTKTASEWTEEGIAFKNQKNMAKAMECFDQAIATDSTFGKAYYMKGFINDQNSKLAEEAELYEKAIAKGYNKDFMVFYSLGVALGKLKRKVDAISAYEKSHALNPNHFSSYNNKGNAQMVLGRIKDAVEAYKTAIKINPDRIDVYEGLGPLLEDLGRKEEAIRYYDEGLKIKPNDLMVNINKGTLMTEMGRYDDAIKCFEAALVTNPRAIMTNYRMGNVYTALGNTEKANEYYSVAARQKPNNSWGYCVRGQCFYRLGKKTEAFEDFKKCKEIFITEEGLLNWVPKQINFIRDTLTILLDAEAASGETLQMMKTLGNSNPTLQKFADKMKKLEEDKTKAQDNAIAQMAKRANSEAESNLSELDKIKEEFMRNIEAMQAEMARMMGQMNNLETRVQEIENNLEDMKAELNSKMDNWNKKIDAELNKLDLAPEDQKKLKGYYNAFVQTFSCIHVTSQVIDSGQVKLNVGSSATTILSFFASFAPFAGDALSSGIKSIGEFLKSQEMKKNSRRMKGLAPDATRLSQLIGKSCFDILQNKKKRDMILNVTDKDLRQASDAMFQKIMKFCENLQEKVDSFLYTDLYRTAAERVGHNDANELVGKYIKGVINPYEAQEQFVEEILKQTEEQKETKSSSAGLPTEQKSSSKACCNMF